MALKTVQFAQILLLTESRECVNSKLSVWNMQPGCVPVVFRYSSKTSIRQEERLAKSSKWWQGSTFIIELQQILVGSVALSGRNQGLLQERNVHAPKPQIKALLVLRVKPVRVQYLSNLIEIQVNNTSLQFLSSVWCPWGDASAIDVNTRSHLYHMKEE